MTRPYAGQFVTPGRYAGKVAVVTGSAQGIGQKVAERIGAEGGAVVLVDRAELVHEVAQGIQEAAQGSGSGGSATAVTADLETFAGAQQAVDGGAGRPRPGGRPGQQCRRHHLGPPVRRVRRGQDREGDPPLALSHPLDLPGGAAGHAGQGSGTIVNVSSVATRGMHRVPYAAAKGGVNALTQSLAMEVGGRGIRVVATAPGGTEAPPRKVKRGPEAESATEKAWYQVIVDQTVDSSFLKRYGTLDEQAAPIVFLGSDEASYVTGSILPVAGGDLG